MARNRVIEFSIWAANKVQRGVMEARRELAGLKRVADGLKGVTHGIGAAWSAVQRLIMKTVGVVAAAAAGIGYALKKAFEFERYEVQFATLFRSMDKAKAHMKDLAQFAATTPFELPQIVQASRQLHVFTGGLMGGAASLRMIGDASATTGADLSETAMWVGRMYSMLKGGRPFGEAAMRLQELGILLPETRSRMEALQAAGGSMGQMFGLLYGDLKRFQGGMETASKTGEGLVSTLRDNVSMAIAQFGKVLQNDAKDQIAGLISWLDRLSSNGTIEAWAKKAREALRIAAEVGKALVEGGDRRTKALEALKDLLVGALEMGAENAGAILVRIAPLVGELIGKAAMGIINAPGKGGAWQGKVHGALDSAEQDPRWKRLPGEGRWAMGNRRMGIYAEHRERLAAQAQGSTAEEAEARGRIAMGGGKGEARIKGALGDMKGIANQSASWDEMRAAAKADAKRYRDEAELKRKAAEAEKAFLADIEKESQKAEDARIRAAKASLKALVKNEQDAAAAMAEAKREVYKEAVKTRDAELNRLEEERVAIAKNKDLSLEERKEKVAEIDAQRDKLKKSPILDPKGAKPWQDLLEATEKGLKGAGALRERDADLSERARRFRVSTLTPREQIADSEQRIADTQKAIETEKDPAKKLDLKEKLQAELEGLFGLKQNLAKGAGERSIGLGEIFTRSYGQTVGKRDPQKQTAENTAAILEVMRKIEKKPGGLMP